MKRSIHITVSLLAIIILIRPFDCFASSERATSQIECCLKGKCTPSAKSDDCCRSSVPDASQFVVSKIADHFTLLPAVESDTAAFQTPQLGPSRPTGTLRHPPPGDRFASHSL